MSQGPEQVILDEPEMLKGFLGRKYLPPPEKVPHFKKRRIDKLYKTRRAHLIINPFSGHKKGIEVGDFVAKELGFSRISSNSMDAVSDRDFVLDYMYSSSVIMTHLSRLAEEMVLWSSEEFGFVRMGENHSTGSSIMPQKRNPDFAELGRGRSGRVYGNLVGFLTTLKGLPLTYNRDLQEDK